MSPVFLPADFPKLLGQSNFANWECSFQIYAKEYANIYDGTEINEAGPRRPPLEDYMLRMADITAMETSYNAVHLRDCAIAQVQIYEVLQREHNQKRERFTEARILLWQSLSPTVQSCVFRHSDAIEASEIMSTIRSLYQPEDYFPLRVPRVDDEHRQECLDITWTALMRDLQLDHYVDVAAMFTQAKKLKDEIETLGGLPVYDTDLKEALLNALSSDYDAFKATYNASPIRHCLSVGDLVVDLKRQEAWLKARPQITH